MTIYLTTDKLAERLGVSEGTLRYWRSCDNGPLSFRAGKTILYAIEDVEEWEDEQRRISGRGGVESRSSSVTNGRSAS